MFMETKIDLFWMFWTRALTHDLPESASAQFCKYNQWHKLGGGGGGGGGGGTEGHIHPLCWKWENVSPPPPPPQQKKCINLIYAIPLSLFFGQNICPVFSCRIPLCAYKKCWVRFDRGLWPGRKIRTRWIPVITSMFGKQFAPMITIIIVMKEISTQTPLDPL